MELEQDIYKEVRFIPLVSAEDELDVDVGFDSVERVIPDLGSVWLSGTSGFMGDIDWYFDHLGIAIIGEQIVITPAIDLYRMGLFEIGVEMEGLRTQTTCKMILPKYGLDLETEIDRMERWNRADPDDRYYGFSYKWKIRGDDRNLTFFAPEDPKFLSQLRFSFSQIHNLPESPK